jgi:hypothetical protein
MIDRGRTLGSGFMARRAVLLVNDIAVPRGRHLGFEFLYRRAWFRGILLHIAFAGSEEQDAANDTHLVYHVQTPVGSSSLTACFHWLPGADTRFHRYCNTFEPDASTSLRNYFDPSQSDLIHLFA